MDERFARTELLLGAENLRLLATKTVAIVGVGGVGSYTVEALARSGIGHFKLIDFDVIVKSNLNRQLHALESTLGQPKVLAMQKRLLEINPGLKVETFQTRYTSETREELINSDLDYVVDAIDQVPSKVDLINTCYQQQLPIISAMGAGNKLDPLRFTVTDISKTHTDPLAKAVRTKLRKVGITTGVKVVFSTELPIHCSTENADLLENKETTTRPFPGSIAFVPSVAGLIIAAEVVKDLLNLGQSK